MLTHVRKHCKVYVHNNVDNTQSLLNFERKLDGQNGDVIVNTQKFDQELIRKALSWMITIYEQPFSMVEKEGFKQFVKMA